MPKITPTSGITDEQILYMALQVINWASLAEHRKQSPAYSTAEKVVANKAIMQLLDRQDEITEAEVVLEMEIIIMDHMKDILITKGYLEEDFIDGTVSLTENGKEIVSGRKKFDEGSEIK